MKDELDRLSYRSDEGIGEEIEEKEGGQMQREIMEYFGYASNMEWSRKKEREETQ